MALLYFALVFLALGFLLGVSFTAAVASFLAMRFYEREISANQLLIAELEAEEAVQ